MRTYFRFQADKVLIKWGSNFLISACRFLIHRFLYVGVYCTITTPAPALAKISKRQICLVDYLWLKVTLPVLQVLRSSEHFYSTLVNIKYLPPKKSPKMTFNANQNRKEIATLTESLFFMHSIAKSMVRGHPYMMSQFCQFLTPTPFHPCLLIVLLIAPSHTDTNFFY